MLELSVVIPVYNEEENLPLLWPELREVLDDLTLGYEVVFVDDGSRDRSAEIIRGFREADLRVRLVRLKENAGETAATDAGFVVDAETAGRMLAVTPRTARRLLHILVEEGLAWPLPPTRTPQPGRPRQFYRLVVEKLESRRRDEPGQRAAR